VKEISDLMLVIYYSWGVLVTAGRLSICHAWEIELHCHPRPTRLAFGL